MSVKNHLPIKVPSGQVANISSSLVDRARNDLHKTSDGEAANQLYLKALAFFNGIDFASVAPISTLEPERLNSSHSDALPMFKEAADLGHREARYCLGAMYADGGAVGWNASAALNWYEKAAKQGHPDAAYQIVKYLRFDPYKARGVATYSISEDRMFELLEIAAGERHFEASCKLGRLYLEKAKFSGSGSNGFYIQAAQWFEQAAELGDAESAYQLAEILCLGDGVPENPTEAARWYAFAAEHNHVLAMLELAYLYERGLGVNKDMMAAAALYRKAARQLFENDDIKGAEQWFGAAKNLGDTAAIKELGEVYFEQGKKFTHTPYKIGWWRKAIDCENVEAAYQLGKYYELAKAPATDFKEALRLYEISATLGHVDAQCALADMHAKGRGTAQDYIKSVKWYVAAAEQGHVEAAYQAGYQFRWGGSGLAINKPEAAKWILYAADHKHTSALFYAGWICNKGFGIDRDDKKSVAYYRMDVKNRNSGSIGNLGVMYANGHGVKKNLKEAFEHYLQAAELGSNIAKNNLANCYADGEGTPVDLDSALAWMSESAEEGCAMAQRNLGVWYRNGKVVLKDDVASFSWFKKAAEQADLSAQNYLGLCYEYGRGVDMDLEEAVYWYQQSADQGDVYAQCNLAIMHENGSGTDKNLDEAIRWYRTAARQMHQRAIDALNRLGVDIHGPVVSKPIRTVTPEISDRVRLALESAMKSANKQLGA